MLKEFIMIISKKYRFMWLLRYGACEVFKNAFSCTLKTFNILDNFYDACEFFENV